LEHFFGTKSRAQIFQFRCELSTLKKGDSGILEVVNKAKHLAMNLSICGKRLDDNDLILAILNGLGSDYDPIVATITSRDLITLDEVICLLSHEQRLHQVNSQLDISITQVVSTGVFHGGCRGGSGKSRGGKRNSHARGNFNSTSSQQIFPNHPLWLASNVKYVVI
jgi:hypothetical protein